MAGRPLDRFLFPGRHGVAVSHLCCQLENPAERVHRARPIWRRVCLPFPRDADCANVNYLARTKQEPSIMVNVAEMPETSQIIVNQPEPTPRPEMERGMIEIEQL